MVAALTVASKETFLLLLDPDETERLSREGSLSKLPMLSKDLIERLVIIEESDGKEKRSYAPSIGSDNADVTLAESLERKDVQADESSNLEGECLDASSSFSLLEGSDLSLVVNLTERRSKTILSWQLQS